MEEGESTIAEAAVSTNEGGEGMAQSTIIFAFALTLMVVGALWLSAYLTKRAVHQVIGAFCGNNALAFREAKSRDDLGLTPPNLVQRLTHFRDYKPFALKFLIDRDIVHVTQDGKLYLTDDDKLTPDFRCPVK
jgi:hypothetical protein